MCIAKLESKIVNRPHICIAICYSCSVRYYGVNHMNIPWFQHFPYKLEIHVIFYFVSGCYFRCMLLWQILFQTWMINQRFQAVSFFVQFTILFVLSKAKNCFSLIFNCRYCWKGKKFSGEIWIWHIADGDSWRMQWHVENNK
jgi:hypothetical protein